MLPFPTRLFTLSMSLLIAFAQCGVGVSSLYCLCTGTKQVEWVVIEKDDCCATEIKQDAVQSNCCEHESGCKETQQATDICKTDKCNKAEYQFIQQSSVGFISQAQVESWDFHFMDLIPRFFEPLSFSGAEILVSFIADRAPPDLSLSRYLSLIQSYLL